MAAALLGKVTRPLAAPRAGLRRLLSAAAAEGSEHKPASVGFWRTPFPWGDGNHTLFHNPRVNPLPDGYEDEK